MVVAYRRGMPSVLDLPIRVVAQAQRCTERVTAEVHYAYKLIQAGVIRRESIHAIAGIATALWRWGDVGMVPAFGAYQNPDGIAIIDDEGSMTYRELNDAINAVAHGLLARGVRSGDGVAIVARNHRWFIIAHYGCARVGARIILLNTEFSGPHIVEVSQREGARLIIYDDEYTDAVALADPVLGKIRALGNNPDSSASSGSTDEDLAALIARSDTGEPPKVSRRSSVVILTSGTTGAPKGAQRHTPLSLAPVGGVFSCVPFRSGEVTALPSPMFHALGYLHAAIALVLGSTLVLHRKFDPAKVIGDIPKYNVTAIVAVPVMLSRMLDALEAMDLKPNMSSLRIVFVSGSQLGAELATRALNVLGPVVYNLYGSTEMAFASIATPRDLQRHPATVGPVMRGVRVKIMDDAGSEVPRGEVGRIFVGNTFPFEGYTGGGGKCIIDGLMSSGDVGYLDHDGLLYVSGRDDDMIISGGENVFPAEVEDLLSGHPDVVEATAVGVEDSQWGERLRAFVVARPGVGLTEDAVKDYVRHHLARYKVPREVVFLAELPRNPTGKILKRQLRHYDGV